jgi:prepilin peptidase CpaA
MLQFLETILVAAFAALVILAAQRDVVSYVIPNWISAALVATFPLAAFATGLPLLSVAVHAGVGVTALLVGMGLFALRVIGGGDAKLLAAVMLWLGWPAGLSAILVMGLAGGALALGLQALRASALRPYLLSGPAWITRLAEPGEAAPYGVAIALGALAAFPNSPLMVAFAPF